MLKPKKFGIAGGIIWGGCMFLTTLLSLYTGYGTTFLNMMSSIYPGFTISAFGCFLGLIYGFFDAFIGLYLLAWIYNKLS